VIAVRCWPADREPVVPEARWPADRVCSADPEAKPGVVPGFGRQSRSDWGLGFEIRDRKAPHWTGQRNSPPTFGHFGRSGSFLCSLLPPFGLECTRAIMVMV
jgi:hypothetical protein